jgi:hypothetical protein
MTKNEEPELLSIKGLAVCVKAEAVFQPSQAGSTVRLRTKFFNSEQTAHEVRHLLFSYTSWNQPLVVVAGVAGEVHYPA